MAPSPCGGSTNYWEWMGGVTIITHCMTKNGFSMDISAISGETLVWIHWSNSMGRRISTKYCL